MCEGVCEGCVGGMCEGVCVRVCVRVCVVYGDIFVCHCSWMIISLTTSLQLPTGDDLSMQVIGHVYKAIHNHCFV